MERAPLPAEEVIKSIEHKSPSRVPMMIKFWNWAPAFEDREPLVSEIQAQYPEDVFQTYAWMPNTWEDPSDPNHPPGYCWMNTPKPAPIEGAARGHDAQVALTDWAMLDDILAAWPDPNMPKMFTGQQERMEKESGGRYTMLIWWYCFYERLWNLRGMENLMCDFYENPDKVHRLMDALTDFYCTLIRRAGRELGPHAIFTSDDVGMQTGPMFSPEIFREFFKPRYERIFRTAHENGMHFWLHACGDIRKFLDDFIEAGLDVIHPIQKYTMDEREVARRFGGRISFWSGMDVQQVLPRGTPEDVRREVRFMIDTYDRPDGGCMITAGNAVTPDVPVENLRAFYDETYNYGLAHRKRVGG